MHDDLRHLLNQTADFPADVDARRVLADWLIDADDPLGEFIHAQLQLRLLDRSHPEWTENYRRQEQFRGGALRSLANIYLELEPFYGISQAEDGVVRDGMFRTATGEFEWLQACANEQFALPPFSRLVIENPTNAPLASLASLDWLLQRATELELESYSQAATLPLLPQLKGLAVNENVGTSSQIDSLFAQLPQLETLEFRASEPAPQLVQHPRFAELRKISLCASPLRLDVDDREHAIEEIAHIRLVHAGDMDTILNDSKFPHLRRLRIIVDTSDSEQLVEAIASSPFAQRCESLAILGCAFDSPQSFMTLLRDGNFSRLRGLVLEERQSEGWTFQDVGNRCSALEKLVALQIDVSDQSADNFTCLLSSRLPVLTKLTIASQSEHAGDKCLRALLENDSTRGIISLQVVHCSPVVLREFLDARAESLRMLELVNFNDDHLDVLLSHDALSPDLGLRVTATGARRDRLRERCAYVGTILRSQGIFED